MEKGPLVVTHSPEANMTMSKGTNCERMAFAFSSGCHHVINLQHLWQWWVSRCISGRLTVCSGVSRCEPWGSCDASFPGRQIVEFLCIHYVWCQLWLHFNTSRMTLNCLATASRIPFEVLCQRHLRNSRTKGVNRAPVPHLLNTHKSCVCALSCVLFNCQTKFKLCFYISDQNIRDYIEKKLQHQKQLTKTKILRLHS